MATPQLMQVRAAARELGVHENTLRRWEEAGLIDAVRLPSGVRRFRIEDVSELRRQMYSNPHRKISVVEAIVDEQVGPAAERAPQKQQAQQTAAAP